MIFPKPPFVLRLMTSGLVNWRIPGKEKCIYLTFDDGPIPEVTPWVLETLANYNAQATFFCVGENIFKYPEIYKKLLEAGHGTGNHTYHHIKAWSTPKADYLTEVNLAHELIKSHLFRPPHGQLTLPLILSLRKRFSLVMWSVLSYDFDQSVSSEKCLSILLKHTKSGDIVVFHDSLKAEPRLKYALPRFLEHFHAKGFVFRSFPENL